MKLSRFLLIPISLVMTMACSSPSQQEIVDREGARQLQDARNALKQQHYDAARDTIMSLRRNHPLALQARKQAILLLDSVELFAARDSLAQLPEEEQITSLNIVPERERLEIKVQFFERKLKEDQP